jgi:2,3-dimethylmalate lyase
MTRPTFRQLVASERPLVLPGAHDALSALLIKQAGFKAYFVGGFTVAAVRHALPDIGLLGLGEFASAYRDILAASDLPVLVDADNGYGDVKNVVHLVHTYERMGVQAIMLEDQASPKRCGHIAGKVLVSAADMEAKVRAVCGERMNADTFIIARTDAREVYGLDEALRRAERYARGGADGLFVEAPTSIEEMQRIGRSFDLPQLANMLEGGRTPILPPKDLEELGFRMPVYGLSLLMRITKVMQDALADIQSGELRLFGSGTSFEEFKRAIGLPRWAAIEDRYKGS